MGGIAVLRAAAGEYWTVSIAFFQGPALQGVIIYKIAYNGVARKPEVTCKSLK